jgi:PIN domain nuclease of toxin-antitoxin system
MQYYLDTNILIFALFEKKNLAPHVTNIIFEYSDSLLASSVVINEVIHLYKTKKFDKQVCKTVQELFATIDELGIQIVPLNRKHLETCASLSIAKDHNDPIDHAIIAQAICDRKPLISSDRKFADYESQKLNFVFNKR